MTYWVIRFLSGCIFRMFFNLKVYGKGWIPKKGPYLICANHCSFFDPVTVSIAIPQKVYWIALKDLYKIRPLSILLRLVDCIQVNGVIKEALDVLNAGKVVGIFPEGRRTYTGKLMKKGKRGAALIAFRSGVAVLPAYISGTQQVYPRRAKFPKIYPVRVHFGKPLVFHKRKEEVISTDVLDNATAKIMTAIATLRDTIQMDKLV
jgi:1-acyl-sn-glycerol-3-phosphate acyltransferase